MKVKCKTLSNTQFDIEVDPLLTIEELKSQIEAVKPDVGLASALKLIYKGRILEDGSTVQSYDFQEGNFVVVMASKAKAAATAKAAPSETASATLTEPEPASTSVPLAETEGISATSVAASAPTEPRQSNEQVELLCAMGFAREDVIMCLQAAYDNADRAVEYLTNGIPASARSTGADEMASGVSRPTPFPAIPTAASPAPDLERQAEVAAAMEELQSLPNFSEIVSMLQENPASLQQILPTLAQEKPELYEVISANREVFAELIVGGQSSWGVGRRLRGREGGGFRFTPAELEAISRLQQLGFTRAVVIEAYVACDKNEEITANYLFEHGADLGGD